jgi:hypothetical protein
MREMQCRLPRIATVAVQTKLYARQNTGILASKAAAH